ncbi:unnamed protein product [Orchesella dallaii]|uniref:Uncharacterized protein n=1 Tax=Orchesella dallaii TaxID=48710 RepID=A0ABP1REH0_9HEXA
MGSMRYRYFPSLSIPLKVDGCKRMLSSKLVDDDTQSCNTRRLSTSPSSLRNTRFILTSNSSSPPPIQPPILNPIDKLGTCDEIFLVQKGCSKEGYS